jgi:hypothetical protein
MHFVVTERLEAPQSALFDIISDPRRRTEWQSSLRAVHLHSAGAPGVGTRWREVTRGGVSFEMAITQHERPVRWAERGQGWIANASLLVDFLEAGDATNVRVTVDIHFKGPFNVLAPVVRRLMPAALAADLRRAGALALKPAS